MNKETHLDTIVFGERVGGGPVDIVFGGILGGGGVCNVDGFFSNPEYTIGGGFISSEISDISSDISSKLSSP